jgi:hypothetical protein
LAQTLILRFFCFARQVPAIETEDRGNEVSGLFYWITAS